MKTFNKIMNVIFGLILLAMIPMVLAIGMFAMTGAEVGLDGGWRMWFILLTVTCAATSFFIQALRFFGVRK